MMEFSDKLKQLRKSKGITQEELANNVFVSRSVIAKYESGNIMPTRENAEKLAVFFGVKLSYLIDEEEQVKMSLDEIRNRKKLLNIISIIGLIMNLIYSIICFIPIFPILLYANPVPVYDYESIISATFKYYNPVGLITFLLCIVNLIIFAVSVISTKHKKASQVRKNLPIVLLIISVFLIILSIAFSAISV